MMALRVLRRGWCIFGQVSRRLMNQTPPLWNRTDGGGIWMITTARMRVRRDGEAKKTETSVALITKAP
ncbi:hypothetical protein L195_g025950 [Trifolium pratense]|uniref:Uncharacterized protein n=1 Tax=Trifolium pratense TaxID=57577 RepID=A0A2K3NHZ3_TRIPR|nr:hypothetical protein L195_g025950 [Trifolium pratense]